MARGRGGAGGGVGGFGSGAAAADANAAAAKSSTTTATALNVPASALQLFYDLASVDEVRIDCAEALVIAIEGSEASISAERQWKGRGIRFRKPSVAAPACVDSFPIFSISLRLLLLLLFPSVAPPFPLLV